MQEIRDFVKLKRLFLHVLPRDEKFVHIGWRWEEREEREGASIVCVRVSRRLMAPQHDHRLAVTLNSPQVSYPHASRRCT